MGVYSSGFSSTAKVDVYRFPGCYQKSNISLLVAFSICRSSPNLRSECRDFTHIEHVIANKSRVSRQTSIATVKIALHRPWMRARASKLAICANQQVSIIPNAVELGGQGNFGKDGVVVKENGHERMRSVRGMDAELQHCHDNALALIGRSLTTPGGTDRSGKSFSMPTPLITGLLPKRELIRWLWHGKGG